MHHPNSRQWFVLAERFVQTGYRVEAHERGLHGICGALYLKHSLSKNDVSVDNNPNQHSLAPEWY